ERHREEPLLGVAALDASVNVEEGAALPAGERDDPAWPLDHVERARLVLRLRDVDGLGEARGDLAKLVGGALRLSGGPKNEGGETPTTTRYPRCAHLRALTSRTEFGWRQDVQDLSSTRRSSSSLPGWRIASTWSPGCSSVEPIALSDLPLRVIEISREPWGSFSLS